MKKSFIVIMACLLLCGCGGQTPPTAANPSLTETTPATEAETIAENSAESQLQETKAIVEEVKEPEIVYQIDLNDTAFADVVVLSDTLYAYKTEEASNWIVAKCEDHSIVEIQTGEELVPYLQDDAFAFNNLAQPNNYLYDAEGNLLWEGKGKFASGNGPDIDYTLFSITCYADDVISFDERKGFKTVFIGKTDDDFDYKNYIQVIDFGRVHGMPFANGYLTTDVNYKTPFGIFNIISREQERIELSYEDYFMSVYDSSVSTDGWIYVNFSPKNLFGKDDSATVTGFYNVETGEARFMENFYAVSIKHFPENGNTLSPVKNGVAVMYGETEVWYGKTSEHIQDPPHYLVYDVENGTVLKEDLQDVKMSEDEFALIMDQDGKWQYADVTTFAELSEKYDGAALFQNDMGIVLQSGHPSIIDRDFNILYTDDRITAEDITSMGHGYYKVKMKDDYRLLTFSVEIIE